jgi:spore germination protein KB
MKDEGKFGVQEATWLCVIAIIAKVFFTSPAVVASLVGPAGWYMSIASTIVAFVGFALIVRLLKRFPNRGLPEIYELALGRVFGFIFSCILGVFFLFVVIQNLSEFQEVLDVYIFQNTPDWYTILIFVICLAVLSFLGLESIARTAKIFSFFIMTGFLSVLLLASENYNTSNLFPILGYGIEQTIKQSVIRSSAFGEIILLVVFAGSLQGTRYVKKAGFAALIISGIILTLSIISYILTFPFYIAAEVTSPMYELSQLIDYGRFLQRIESVFLLVWILATLISSTAIFYAFISIYCYIFRIKDKRPIIIAGCIIIFTGALFQANMSAIVTSGLQMIRNIGSIPFFVMPIIALVVSAIRKKREGSDDKV